RESGERLGRDRARLATWSWVTRCTSIEPAREAIRSPVVPVNSRRSRPCRETPTMIMVALAPEAKSTTAAETSSPTTSWQGPPPGARRRRARLAAGPAGLGRPGGGGPAPPRGPGAGGAWGGRGPAPNRGPPPPPACHRHDDPLLGRPRLVDPVCAAVVV